MDSQLRLQQSTSLTITPQLQQAIQLLQLPYHELETFLRTHLEQNPFLTTEEETPEIEPTATTSPPHEMLSLSFSGENTPTGPRGLFDLKDMPDTLIPAASLTLHEHLTQQIGSQITCLSSRLIGVYLVQFIQSTGYFEGNIETIAQTLGTAATHVEAVLKIMQRFDPSGVCAQTLKGCLRIQLEDRGLLSPSYDVLLDHLELVAKGEVSSLARKCKISEDILRQMLQEIRRLSPKPGLALQQDTVPDMTPEVLMHWDPTEKSWAISLNPETTPKVLLNRVYYTHVQANVTEVSEKRYLSEQMSHANWLIKALNQRSVTLLRVSTEIVRQQQDFFNLGIRHLKPLILKDIAQTLQLHESTISRVTTGKYIATPRGTFELKYFFSSGLDSAHGASISSESVRHRIQVLIEGESDKKTLSDDAIAAILQKEGIDIARRTVAKYREVLGVPAAFQRRRWRNLNSKGDIA